MTRARLSHFILLAAVGHALNPLPAAVATVRRAGVDVHIVGAIHSTPTSARDVDETVRATRPSAVVLELCGGRWRGLLNAREREVASPRCAVLFKIKSAELSARPAASALHRAIFRDAGR